LRPFPPQWTTFDKGHGRIEERRIWTSVELTGYIEFPHARQVFCVERIVQRLDGSPLRHETIVGVTSLPPDRGSPERLLALNRGHWGIENKIHWVRDVTFDEDRSQVRKGAAVQVMASLRNIAISLLRLAGATNIAAALRSCAARVGRALRLIGL
jgi:hypothetical protein